MTVIGTPLQTVFASQPGLAFIYFIAFSLMVALGVRFALYAYWNRERTEIDAQAVLWDYLVFIGLAAALYGLLGGVEAVTAVLSVSPVETPYRDGVLLAFLLLLGLTMREIYENDALSNTESGSAGSRAFELCFTLVVTGALFGPGLFGPLPVFDLLEGAGAVAFGAYGLVYGRRQLGRSSVRGTMIDSLLRHLLPVVVFAVLVLTIDLTTLLGLDVAVVRHIQVVFVIMTATALMTATIKLRQNVASL